MRVITVTTFSGASFGAVSFLASFPDGISHHATFNAKDRSKIALNSLILCGIIANGEIFKVDGEFYFMSSHLTMVAKPCDAFTVPQLGFVKLHHLPMLTNGGI